MFRSLHYSRNMIWVLLLRNFNLTDTRGGGSGGKVQKQLQSNLRQHLTKRLVFRGVRAQRRDGLIWISGSVIPHQGTDSLKNGILPQIFYMP